MEKIPSKKENLEREPRTKLLVLSASMNGEDFGRAMVQIDKDFDVKAAKVEFEASLTEEQKERQAMAWGDPMLQEFADWLVKKGLAKAVDITNYHEGN